MSRVVIFISQIKKLPAYDGALHYCVLFLLCHVLKDVVGDSFNGTSALSLPCLPVAAP